MTAERSRAFVTSVVLAMPVADMMRSMGLRRGGTDRMPQAGFKNWSLAVAQIVL